MQRCLRGDMCKMVYSCPAEYSPRAPFPYWNANQINNIHLQPIKDIWNGAIWFMLNLKLSGLLSQSFTPHLKCFLSQLDPKIFPFVSINMLTTSLCYILPGKTEVIYHTAAAAAKSLQSCPTLCDPIDGSQPGSPIPGILQARVLEWVAISFSNAWKWKVKVKSLSRVRLLTTPWIAAYQAP